MTQESKIPNPTIKRLIYYSRPLETLLETGPPIISSEKLAGLCGVNPAQVRKDLAYFGEFGVRGVGYDVRNLLSQIKGILASDRVWRLCIVGMGNLGNSLVEHENFKKRGYIFVAIFDSDDEKIGMRLPCGLKIEPNTKIGELVRKLNIQIGVISTPPKEAQRMTGLLCDAGVHAILNFAPIQVRAPKSCIVENVDFSMKFEDLAYHLEKL